MNNSCDRPPLVAAFHKCGKSLIPMSRYRNEYINNNCPIINDFLAVFWKTVEDGMDPPLRAVTVWNGYETTIRPCTSLWLQYNKFDSCHVSALQCKVCTKFVDRIRSSRNFNSAFINGSTNLWASRSIPKLTWSESWRCANSTFS